MRGRHLEDRPRQTAPRSSTPAEPDDAPSDAGVGVTEDVSCSVVLPSDYDQSCAVDDDCVEVGEVPSCPAGPCDGCTTQAINRDAQAAYAAAFSQAVGSGGPGFCGCPCGGVAICRGGACKAGGCGPGPSDTLPACADAGGRCMYAANTTCTEGLAGGCEYADEVCCID